MTGSIACKFKGSCHGEINISNNTDVVVFVNSFVCFIFVELSAHAGIIESEFGGKQGM